MKQRIGICTNFGNCPNADRKKKIPITGGEDSCPNCGGQLVEEEEDTSNSVLAVIKGIIILLLLLATAAFAAWKVFLAPKVPTQSEVKPEPILTPVKLTTTAQHNPTVPSPATEETCLLDQEPTDEKSVQAHQMLPMTTVASLKNYPIPTDFKPWMKKVSQVTETEFAIMNREVNVAEFKQYFATLSEVEKNKLGHNWQQDRNGAPAADNTPVGAIPWEAAQGYANWLSQQTQCKLSLPSYNQWVAASVQHADPNKVVTRQHQQASRLMPTSRPQEPDKVFDLLGNLREWVNDKTTLCPNGGHFAVGEDYKTWLQNLYGEPYCETMAIDTVGFRLVRMK